MAYSYTSNKSIGNVRELFFLSYSSFSDVHITHFLHMFTVDCLKLASWNSIRFGRPRDHFVLKIQEECHPKCARKVSGLSRKGPRLTGTSYRGRLSPLFGSEGFPVVFIVFVKTNQNLLFNGSFQNLSFLQPCEQILREQDSLTMLFVLICCTVLIYWTQHENDKRLPVLAIY